MRRVLLFFLVALNLASYAQPAPFQHELVATGFGLPSSAVFLPDGRMLVTTLQGRIFITTPLDQRPVLSTIYMDIPNVNNTGEHGLIEVMLDPEFSTNNHFYVFYSTLDNKNRVSRFTHAGNIASPASEFVVYETITPFNSCCHIGGGMSFVDNNTILLCVGDDFAPALAQDMASPYGKVHRVRKNGTIPTDNPFFDATPGNFNASGVLKSIYCSGLRNPFRASVNPNTGDFLIGEVGGNDHTVAWEDLHVASPAANFGWPFCGDGGRTPTGACLDPLYSDPVFAYPHAGSGASITAGIVYTGTMFPPEWQGRYIYGDYARSELRYLTFGPGGAVTGDFPFLNPTIGGNHPLSVVKLLQGPDGSLYYIDLVSEFITYTGSIHRIFYSANQAPECGPLTATPNDGPGPTLTTTLSGSATDAEGDVLAFSWFLGDGSAPLDGATVQHTYTAPGTYLPALIVSDGNSTVTCGSTTITVGAPPFAQILSPSTGSLFRSGDVVTFTGIGFDDDPITEANYTWTAVFNHDDHIHPEAGATGTSTFDLIIPTTGHGYTGTTYYTVTLTVTDQDGLQFSQSVQIFPEKVDVTITSDPPGLQVLVEGLPVLTPYTFDQAIGYEVQVAVPIGAQCLGNTSYTFGEWSTGAPMIHGYTVPANNSSFNATFTAAGPCGSCGQFLALDGVDDGVKLSPFTLTGNFTLEFWQRPLSGFSNADAILGDSLTFSLDLAGGRLRYYHNGAPRVSSLSTMVANQWNHYAVVRTGQQLVIYVNGVANASTNNVANAAPVTISSIGRSLFPGAYGGGLDELRIWSVARTPAQLQANSGIHIDPDTPGLEAYWRFDQEAGEQVVQDLSPNLRQGLMGGSLLPQTSDPGFSPTNGPMQLACDRTVDVQLRMLLQGAYVTATGLMRDALRSGGLLPLAEPYTALGFTLTAGTGGTVLPAVFTTEGPDAIVDWVLVERRDPNVPATVLDRVPALLQRDGDVVDLDGTSPLRFVVNGPAFHLAVRHRNHLSAMSKDPVAFGVQTATLDLSLPGTQTFGTNAQATVDGRTALWAGDCNDDGTVRYTGSNNDRDLVLQAIGGSVPTAVAFGYRLTDVNLDGVVRYAGGNNDRDVMLVVIGGSVPTAVRVQQLP
jgi:glucose/arabinose dehydrogenase